LNDSKAPFGSNKDRHENIGTRDRGEALGRFIRHPALGITPLYLEVPGYSKEGPDLPNMGRLFELAGRPFPRSEELAVAQQAQAAGCCGACHGSEPAKKPAPARKPRARKAPLRPTPDPDRSLLPRTDS